MRLTINKDQLLKALLAATKAAPAKSANPILVNLKLELNEKGFEITGSDQSFTIKATVPYMINDKQIIKDARPGAVLVNAIKITEIVKLLEIEEVSLELIDESILKIDDGKSLYKLNALDAREGLDVKLDTEGCSTFEIPAQDFTNLVSKTSFAVATRSQHMVLTCVRLEAEDRNLTATSTDSARLSRASIEIDTDVRFGVNIPGKTLSDICGLFEGNGNLKISVSEIKAIFEYDNLIISSSLITGPYPPVGSVIPKIFNQYLEINSKELLGAINRARLMSEETEPVVKLSMKDEEIEISARSDSSGSAKETISTFRFTGERLDISFNSQFVIDAVRAVGGEDVTFCFVGEMKPFAIKNPANDKVIEIITPMRTF